MMGETWKRHARLKFDVKSIFMHHNGIQIALLSEIGNMFAKLSNAKQIFEYIIADLNLKHIQVKANEPYVALVDTTCWKVLTCGLIGNLCDKGAIVIQQLTLQHVETGDSILCFNAHMPSTISTPTRKRTCVLKMCHIATESTRSGIPQSTAAMPWVIAGDLNTD